MYTPKAFLIDRTKAEAVIDACDLGAIVTLDANGSFDATWLPMLRVGDRLLGHVAKANLLWQNEGTAIVMFRNVDGYVSPSWYRSKNDHGRVVPTWNYVAVNVHGTLRALTDATEKLAVVTALTNRHESRIGSNWKVSDAPADYIDSMLNAIVGIEVTIQRIEGKEKLSQNRESEDIAGVIAANPNHLGDAVRAANDLSRS